ncbi:unnamed protein product [Ilex paraguariensis]|uniref:Uncharacterized protein n=1 Tax=Ilex paraguariensis TaxID=185542 RepID=A0ABC8UIV6_9AQUA
MSQQHLWGYSKVQESTSQEVIVLSKQGQSKAKLGDPVLTVRTQSPRALLAGKNSANLLTRYMEQCAEERDCYGSGSTLLSFPPRETSTGEVEASPTIEGDDLDEEIPMCVEDEDCYKDIQDVYDQLHVQFLKQQ